MNTQKQTSSMIGRRLLANLVDILLLLILFFFFYFVLFKPVMNNIYNISSHKDNYTQCMNNYNSIREEYGIISFDSSSNIIYNTVTDDIKNSFLNDSRVIDLTKTIQDEAMYVFKYTMLGCLYALLCSSFIAFILLPICLRTKTLGRLCMKLTLIRGKEKKTLPIYFVLLRGVVYIVIDVMLGILSLGIIPLIDLLVAILSKENRSIVDRLSNCRVVEGSIPIEVNESIQD